MPSSSVANSTGEGNCELKKKWGEKEVELVLFISLLLMQFEFEQLLEEVEVYDNEQLLLVSVKCWFWLSSLSLPSPTEMNLEIIVT